MLLRPLRSPRTVRVKRDVYLSLVPPMNRVEGGPGEGGTVGGVSVDHPRKSRLVRNKDWCPRSLKGLGPDLKPGVGRGETVVERCRQFTPPA